MGKQIWNSDNFNKILVGIIGGLAAVILVGTIYGVIKKNKTPTPEILVSQGKAMNLAAPADDNIVDYYDLGKIRTVTTPDSSIKDDTGTAMVIDPWLAYPDGDTVFYEELARKRGVIKAIFTAYFSSHTKKDLLSATETVIVSDLLAQINAELSLGKVSDIYFTDYLFLE